MAHRNFAQLAGRERLADLENRAAKIVRQINQLNDDLEHIQMPSLDIPKQTWENLFDGLKQRAKRIAENEQQVQ